MSCSITEILFVLDEHKALCGGVLPYLACDETSSMGHAQPSNCRNTTRCVLKGEEGKRDRKTPERTMHRKKSSMPGFSEEQQQAQSICGMS